MSKFVIRLGAAALASAAALATSGAMAGASTASTQTPQTLAQIQAKAATAISDRVNDLNAAVAKVNANKNLGSDAATLDAYLQRDLGPLQALGTKIAGDTTVSQAQADYQDIFEDYRVYALVLPAAWQAGNADGITVTAVPALQSFSSKAQSKVNATNQATLQPMIDSLNTDISGATSNSSGVSSTVMSYTPLDWNNNHSILSATKATLTTANGDVKSARSEVQQIRQFLKQSRPAVKSGTGTGTSSANADGTPTTAG
ncbi:MAG TPA: hypothetical protein VGF87_02230 [Acidimicrobiales bacterium]|jgi:hypothetical protein